MKKILVLLPAIAFSVSLCYAQSNLSKQSRIPFATINLVGVWQENDTIEGSGLLQNFQFFNDGRFELNLCNPNEDIRDIIAIKGRYRLIGDSLMVTILSKNVIIGGQINLDGGGSETKMFTIEGGDIKEIYIENPKELSDPLYITIISPKCIRIENEIYYKISSDPNHQ